MYGVVQRGATRNPYARARQDLLILDYYGGDGRADGSPAIFERVLHRLAVPHRLFVFEKNALNARRLKDALKCPSVRIFPGNCGEVIDDALLEMPALMKEQQFGLMYIDPNNARIPLTAMRAVLQRSGYDRMDVLIHAATRTDRRLRGAGISRATLKAAVADLGKRHVFFKYFGHSNQDWALIAATNWPDARFPADYRNITSPEGAALWARLTLTTAERDRREQPDLFPDSETHIVPTPSISSTHASAPSAPLSSGGLRADASAAASGHPPTRIM